MSAWIVYSKDGTTERCRLKKLEYSGSFMNERTVTATFECESEVAFDVFDYIEYRGEKFELEAIPSVKKTSSRNYEYELRFVSLKYELERCEMRDIVPNDNGIVYPTPLTFSFTGDVTYLAERIQANLDALYGKGVWSIVLAEGVTSEDKNITISQQNCWNALSLVNTTYELDFTVKGRVVTIGGNKPSISHIFQYGKGKGLYEIERSADTETGIVTKLRAYGGTKNLDYSYPKKPEWSDSILDTSFVLSPLRLMLPSFKTDGKTDYIMADESLVAKYGIREASVIYEDIYPSITGVTNEKGQAIDEIKAVDEVDDNGKTFVVYLHDLGFDLEDSLTTADAQISMKSGAMQGYTFNISVIEKKSDNSYKITLGRITTNSSDTDNFNIPNSSWNMKAGDKFVLLNILMPQEYIRSAENRLLERAKEYLAEYAKTNFSYNVGLHDKFLKQNESVYNELIEGSKLSVYDEELGISEDVTIQSITITENMEDNILPQVKVTLNNKPSASTLDRIQGQIKELSETASNSFSSQSELLQQYRKKLDKPFFDRLFVAVGEDGKELASTDTTSPIAYIKAKYSFVTVGGVTMYAKDENINVPTIVDSLPFDNTTIWYNPTTKQIEVIGGTGGSSGEGVSNFWDLSGIPSWITNTKPTYSYTEIQGTPDLSVYALKSAIPSLDGYAKLTDIPSLNGYATEKWVTDKGYATTSDLDARIDALVNGAPTAYDTLKEIADVLQGNVNSIGDIITALGDKADKATTLSGYGITDAYTKTKIDELLGLYVTLGGSQTITGAKDFTGGLKVNGSPITYDKTNKYWKLEGDLVVTGGVSMYSNDTSYTPSTIMDAIVVDNVTIIKQDGKLVAIGGGNSGGSVLDQVAWGNVLGKPTTLSGYGITDAYTKTNVDSLLGGYLPLTGGTLTAPSSDAITINTSAVNGIGISYKMSDTQVCWIGYDGSRGACLYNSASKTYLSVKDDGSLYYNNGTIIHSGNIGSYNAGSATKLQTARTIWGQSFDGTGNITGDLLLLNSKSISATDSSGNGYSLLYLSSNNNVQLGYGTSSSNYDTYINGLNVMLRYGTARTNGFILNSSGNITIGSSDLASTNYKLYVDGRTGLNGDIQFTANAKYIRGVLTDGTSTNLLGVNDSNHLLIGYGQRLLGYSTNYYGGIHAWYYGVAGSSSIGMFLNSDGNVGIGTANPDHKLYVAGRIKTLTSEVDGVIIKRHQTSGIASVRYLPNNQEAQGWRVGASSEYKMSFEYSSDSFSSTTTNMTLSNAGLLTLNGVMRVQRRSNTSSYLDITSDDIFVKYNGYDSDGYCGHIFYSNDTELFRIDGNTKLATYQGNILATGGVTTNDSMTINGIKLYKSQDGVLYLDGNLVVKGGITMYGSDSTSAPSLIDSLPIASTSAKGIAQFNPSDFSVVNGVVSFVGSIDGGVASSVAWGNITGKPTFATVATSGKYSDLSGTPTTLKNPYSLTINNSGGTAQVTYDGSASKSLSLTKAMVGLGSVENTALSTWAGTSKITTLGTITSGTWNGSKIANAYLANSAITISGTSVSLGGSITQSALRTALGLGSNAYSSTAYLPLSGGKITGSGADFFEINRTDGEYSVINFKLNDVFIGRIGVRLDNTPVYMDGTAYQTIWHSGNDGSGSGLDADLLDGKHLSDILASNVASATKLQTARTIWGQSFDGTGNVSGELKLGYSFISGGEGVDVLNTNGQWVIIGAGCCAKEWDSYIDGYNIRFRYGTSHTTGLLLNSSGNITIGSSDLASTNYKLYVNGKHAVNGDIQFASNAKYVRGVLTDGTSTNLLGVNNANDLLIGYGQRLLGYSTNYYGGIHAWYYGVAGSSSIGMFLNSDGNVGIGTGSPSAKLHVAGKLRVQRNTDTTSYIDIQSDDIFVKYNGYDSDGYCGHIFYSNGVELFRIAGNTKVATFQGNVLTSGGLTMYSARKLKTIQDERGLSLEELRTIKPTRFTWKDGRDNRLHIGGIADDVMKVLPEVIYKTGEDDTLTMDYGNAAFAISASLIKPVVNHEERIKMLEEEVERLKEENKRLKLN